MSQKEDYYSLLGIHRSASEDEIKKAFRKLAKQYHPDQNPNNPQAEQKFKAINEAYDVLKDPQKRSAYDQFGHAAFEGGGGGGGGFHGGPQGFGDVFGDFFRDFMGGGGQGGGGQAPQSGSDLRYDLELKLDDAYVGTKQSIQFHALAVCEDCSGKGTRSAKDMVQCSHCRGSGRLRMQQGFFTVERGCHHCGGEGVLLKDPCKTCKGEGRVRRSRHFSVTIPRGIETGVRMRFSKEGEAGRRGATAGDLYVVVHVKDHPIFERRGEHLSCRLPVPMTVAALGGSVEVPCIDGTRAKLTIPAGTQTSDKFRMRGKGMPVMQSSAFGDMYVEVDVETPVHLTKKQQELLQSFADSLEGKESPASSGFFNKIKSLWQGLKDDAAE